MAQGGLFVIKEDGKLVGLTETRYDSESLLQELLARHPDLLAGDQMDADQPRRWLLVTREVGVPDDPDGADRWSLDHLFIDQDAVPTLVEVKRSSDTRIRREVVGQMLDYAANAVLHWPVETIRAAFERRCEREVLSPDEEMGRFLGPESDGDVFWQKVKTNLQAGRVRLLFVSDAIPAELRRIVEFLNQQMDPAEVLGVEIRQYSGQGLKTLLPRLVGQTAQAEHKKAAGTARGRRWDEASFFAQLADRGDEREMRVARALFDWGRRKMTRTDYGQGAKMGSFIPILEKGDVWFTPIRVYTGYKAAYVELPLGGNGMKAPPFDAAQKRLELVRRLKEIPDVRLAEDVSRLPSIDLVVLAESDRLARFLECIEWAVRLVEDN